MENNLNEENSDNINNVKIEEIEIKLENEEKINIEEKDEGFNLINDEKEDKNKINENIPKMDKNIEENKEENIKINETINKQKAANILIEESNDNLDNLTKINENEPKLEEQKYENEKINIDKNEIIEEKEEIKNNNKIIEETKISDIEEKTKEKEIENNKLNNMTEENEIKEKNAIKENEVKNLDSNTMEKILKYTESNYKEFISEKHFCDYKLADKWRAGYITSIYNEDAIIIDATNPKEAKKKINIKDKNKISYIRKYSLPDNLMTRGSSKNLKNKLIQFRRFHNDFENYMKNCSDFDFYYFLRVTLYYGLDFAMNPKIGSENVTTSFQMILSILDIIIDCLKFIEKNFKEFLIYETNIKNTELTDLVLLEKKYAIFSFFDDIHFLLKKIFADSSQYLDWYINYKKEIIKINPASNTNKEIDSSLNSLPHYKDNSLEKICISEIYDNYLHIFYTLDKEINSSIIAYFVDYFSHYDGFKILFKLVYEMNDININNYNIIFDIQIKLIEDLFLVKVITNAFNNSHQEEKNNLEKYINNYLNKLDEKIFDKIGKNEFFGFFGKIFDIIEKNEEKKKILNEKVIINFAFNKFLSEKKLEKRISFLTEINNIIISTEYNDLYNEIFISQKNNEKELKEDMLNDIKFKDKHKDINATTCLEFCKICHEKNIINFILSNNSHEEIIKRLYPILKVMYINNFGFDENKKETIDELKANLFKALFQRLKEVEKNNEILWKILQEIIINFTECLIDKDKNTIFVMIKNYFMESISINTNKHSKIKNIFDLLINFSLKSIDEKKINLDKDKIIDISEEKLYCLEVLLQILLNKNKINELNINLSKEQKIEIINLSIEGITNIIKKTDYNENIIKIVTEKIISTIFTLTNIPQNIILLEKLKEKNVMFKEFTEDFCSKKSEEEIIKLINDLYIISVPKEDKDEELYNFDIKLEKILDFIFILFQSPKCIKTGFEKMQIFSMLYSPNETITRIFCEKLKKNLSLIKYEIKIYIFENILIKPESPFEIKNMNNYKLLKEFIINLNTLTNKFTYIEKIEFMVLFEKISDIFGYEKLFTILLENENNEIQNDIQELLSDIYLNVKFCSVEKYKNFWNEIVTSIINKLKDLVAKANDIKNTIGIKGIIGLFKKIIEKSYIEGEVIKNKQIINSLFDKIKNNSKDKDNNSKDKNNNEIKVIFEYNYLKKEGNDNKLNENNESKTNLKQKDKDKDKIKEEIVKKKEGEIYKDEFFYYVRYLLSYEFEIPLKCIQISIPGKNNELLKLNLLDDISPIYDEIKNIYDSNKKNSQAVTIKVKKITNPLCNDKIINMKNIIKSNKELLSIFRDLLKRRNCDNTSDILEIVKDHDDFIKKGITDDFNKLMNERNENNELLNELFNFDGASIFYKNLIITNLYKFILIKEENNEDIISKLIKSNIWNNKLKNIDIKKNKTDNTNINKNEYFEEIKFLYNLVNIYKSILVKIKNDSNDDINNLELISSKIFEIYYIVIDDCINKNIDSNEIKNIYYEIFETINELIKNKEIISLGFIKYIIKEKEKIFDDIKFCFVEGILKNKFPFVVNKIKEFIVSLLNNQFFKTNKEDIKDIRNNFYLLISSILLEENNNNKYVIDFIIELVNNINEKNENIYIYNIKSYFEILSEIILCSYEYISKNINYENYIIKSVIPYIFEPLIKKISKYSNKLNDIFFGGQCYLLYNYLQLIKISELTKEQYFQLFNYKGKNIKKYLFEEIIMLNCDKETYKNHSQLKKSLQIYHSIKEANHLFICLLIKDINNNNDLKYFLEKIKYYNTLDYWYGDEITDWKLNYNANINESKGISNFIGLKNLGCTCYMNSLMQTFFNIIPFRESFLRFKISQKTKNVLYEVQKLFSSLKFCKTKYYTPETFVNNYDNEKLNVHQQMDIDEFFSNIIDKLENRLKNTENENIIKYFFQGHINDVLTFQEGCTHHRANTSNFYSIQLQIRNKKSLYESLDTLIEGELMNEDNCIFCPDCNKKMPAVKSQNFKILPRMLIFVLKRFEFDFNTMAKIKINDYYEFPIELDMNKYTGEYLNNNNAKDVNNLYKLKSIVIHQGHCEGGHYYAFIRDDNTKEWHQFNDTNVTDFDVKDIPKEAFGGNINKNAYLLFYEKEDISNCEKFDKINEILNLEKNKEDNKEEENDNINLNNDKENNKDNNIRNDNEFNLIKDNENEINTNTNEIKNEINQQIDMEEVRNYLNKKMFSKNYHHLTLELYLNILNSIDSNKAKDLPLNRNIINNNLYNNIHPIEKQIDLPNKPKHFYQNLDKFIKLGKLKIFKSEAKYTNEEIKEKNKEIFQYIIINYFNIVIRSDNRKYLGCYVDLIKSFVINYEYCANYLLEEFSNYNVIMVYLKNCPLYEIKKITVGIIDFAMITSINHFQSKNNTNIQIDQNSVKKEENINENIKISSINDQELEPKEDKDDTFGFVLFGEDEIKKCKEFIKTPQKEDEDFEFLDETKELKKEEDKGPMTRHYLDDIKEKNKLLNKDYNNNTSLDNLPKTIIDLVYNIIFVMKKIKFTRHEESRFLFAVLLKLVQITNSAQILLTEDINMLFQLNILLFQKLSDNSYSESFYDIGDPKLHNITHKILDPKPNELVGGEYDKFKSILLRYDYLLLCNLSYDKEKSSNSIIDSSLSFYDKNYIFELIKYTATKQELNYLANLFKKKSYNNKEIFNNIYSTIKIVINKINDCDDAFYDVFEPENNNEIYKNSKKGNFLKRLRSNIHILLINLYEINDDQLVEYRQKVILNDLFDLFKENKRYYSLCLYIINIIIDIYLHGSEYTKKKNNRMKLIDIKEWLEKNKIAPKLYEIKGIEMYKDTPIHRSLFIDLKKLTEVNKKLKEEYDNEEISKTEKKIGLINNILNGNGDRNKNYVEFDLSKYNYDIGDNVFYGNKKYEIVEVLDEMIKIKEVKENENDNNMELKFQVKGFKEKIKNRSNNKEKECFWIEKDNYKLKIFI